VPSSGHKVGGNIAMRIITLPEFVDSSCENIIESSLTAFSWCEYCITSNIYQSRLEILEVCLFSASRARMVIARESNPYFGASEYSHRHEVGLLVLKNQMILLKLSGD
jgi:hypothetical protein